MNATYAQKQSTAQKTEASSADSVLDSSSQGESLRRKADLANRAAQCVSLPPRPNNTGMPDNLKSGIESLSGFSMDDVRVHYNSSKPATVQALAYTQGTDIHVAPAQEKCLPHEAWHVAQQMAGRVSPTTNINGMPVNDNAALEHEADVMGEKAVQCKMIGVNFANGKVQNTAVQRMAYAKPNEDGTVSAETEQYEGNDDLAKMFGRTDKDENGRYKRPDNVARKVDQYKKEMLTYIASCIQELGEKNNCDYGPHISVVITRGIWFIAINTDFVSDANIEQLKKDAVDVQGQIKTMWDALCVKFSSDTEDSELKADASGNVSDDLAKKQALYIVYRWAGKDNGIVVEQNHIREKKKGVIHGEMATIKFLQKKSNMLNQAEMLFKKAETVIGKNDDDFGCAAAAFATSKAASLAAASEVVIRNITDAVEASQKAAVADRAIDRAAVVATTVATMIATAVAEASPTQKECFEKAQKYVKTACGILNDCLVVGNSLDHHRVVRVGGTKTACFDCGYEMHLHNESGKNNKPDVHKDSHCALEIGPRNAVTMTSNFGSGFPNWIFDDESAASSSNDPDSLKHDSRQNQDYNELYDTFNSLNLAEDGGVPIRMDITDPMKVEWFEGMESYEKEVEKNGEYLKILDELKLLDKAQSLQMKNLIVRHLDTIYNKPIGLYQMSDILSDELKGYSIFKKFFKSNRDLKSIINFERLVVRRLDLNIQGFLAKDNSSSLKIDKNSLIESCKKLKDGSDNLLNVYNLLKIVFDKDLIMGDDRRTVKSGLAKASEELNKVQVKLKNVQIELSKENCDLLALFKSLMAQNSVLSKNYRALLNMKTIFVSFMSNSESELKNLQITEATLSTSIVELLKKMSSNLKNDLKSRKNFNAAKAKDDFAEKIGIAKVCLEKKIRDVYDTLNLADGALNFAKAHLNNAYVELKKQIFPYFAIKNSEWNHVMDGK